jgi:hypothetical protein
MAFLKFVEDDEVQPGYKFRGTQSDGQALPEWGLGRNPQLNPSLDLYTHKAYLCR